MADDVAHVAGCRRMGRASTATVHHGRTACALAIDSLSRPPDARLQVAGRLSAGDNHYGA